MRVLLALGIGFNADCPSKDVELSGRRLEEMSCSETPFAAWLKLLNPKPKALETRKRGLPK